MSVNSLDKYFTPNNICEYTVKKAIEIIGLENITEVVESSAGDGAFIPYIKQYFPNVPHRFYDLYPEHPEIVKYDYKKLMLSYKKGRLTGFNPPFGTSSSLWKAFCKKAATNSDYIVFISPASQYNSNYYFKEGELIYSELLNDVEYRGDEEYGGKDQKVRTCLNIYKVYDREEEEDWRIARLEQDVLITKEGADFYFGTWGAGPICKVINEPNGKCGYIGIKILNESKRQEIENFFQTHYDRNEIIRKSTSAPQLTMHKIKEDLIKHLYPTREERLEQDVLIERDNRTKEYDFIIDRRGWNLGKLLDNIEGRSFYGIKVLNENMRTNIESAIKQLEIDFKIKAENDLRSLSMPEVKQQLITQVSLELVNYCFDNGSSPETVFKGNSATLGVPLSKVANAVTQYTTLRQFC